MPLKALANALGQDDPYKWTDADQQAYTVEQVQTTGQFLIDRNGIVRWRQIEGETDGLTGLMRFPSEEQVLAAARALQGAATSRGDHLAAGHDAVDRSL